VEPTGGAGRQRPGGVTVAAALNDADHLQDCGGGGLGHQPV
jgi:hypothetical protein